MFRNTIQELEAAITRAEQEHKRMKQINLNYRKGDTARLAELGFDVETHEAERGQGVPPFTTHELTALRERINNDRHRLVSLKARQARYAAAQGSKAGVTIEPWGTDDVRITFAEKPERSILDALRAARFFWCKGSWNGPRAELPGCVTQLLQAQ